MTISSLAFETAKAFPRTALVVSSDAEVVSQLSELLRRDYACDAQQASSYSDAREKLEGSGLQSIFIDLRGSDPNQNPVPLLHHLARGAGRQIPVIAIGQEGYTFEWAGLADATIDAHLDLPLDREQMSHQLQQKLADFAFEKARLGDGPKVIRTPNLHFETHSPELIQVLDQVVTAAPFDVTLLLVGETGTGKTTLARLIHDLSNRSKKRLMTVGCGALPSDLIESELFGHVKGAFTGADYNKIGKFEAVQGGTLLLDEIDVLSTNQQAKLLRVIETGEFEPIGSNDTRHSQARLIVASNVDLESLMQRDQFRADLYYRLNVVEFHLPPLRNRPQDIVPLTLGFIQEFCSKHQVSIRRIHPEFLMGLKNYHWPGNIRELKNHIRRAVLFSKDGILTGNDLAPNVLLSVKEEEKVSAATVPQTLSEKVASSEQEILLAALAAHDYKREATARSLGISRVGLYKKMKKYGMIEASRTRPNKPR